VHAPTAVFEQRTVSPNLKTDDVLESNAARRPQVAERDANALVADVDIEVREREE